MLSQSLTSLAAGRCSSCSQSPMLTAQLISISPHASSHIPLLCFPGASLSLLRHDTLENLLSIHDVHRQERPWVLLALPSWIAYPEEAPSADTGFGMSNSCPEGQVTTGKYGAVSAPWRGGKLGPIRNYRYEEAGSKNFSLPLFLPP